MFLVFNKQKIYTYAVSLITVVVLFCVSTSLNQTNQNTIQTSASNSKKLPIYNVQTQENKVALTMNCAWNADDIDSILETLKNNNTKITFFMVGDWIDKYPEAAKKIYEHTSTC
jgi:enoyl reductase-like protein